MSVRPRAILRIAYGVNTAPGTESYRQTNVRSDQRNLYSWRPASVSRREIQPGAGRLRNCGANGAEDDWLRILCGLATPAEAKCNEGTTFGRYANSTTHLLPMFTLNGVKDELPP